MIAVLLPNALTVGIGIWWLLNTVSHNFIHQPFFKARFANRIFACYLSIITLVPQRLWREKHLAHHADRRWRWRNSRELWLEAGLVVLAWVIAFRSEPGFVLGALAPGFLLAMALCFVHGYFEHACGTTSYYGRFYNRVFFNDGFHVEHHQHPGLHWARLPAARDHARASKWPAVLRWCDWVNLNALEALVIRSPLLQRWVLASHEQAIRKLTAHLPAPKRIVVIGGALFPRTALVVHRLWPAAQVTVIDANAEHLETCRRWLRGDETLIHARVTVDALPEADLTFIPLAFDQDKTPLYRGAERGTLVVHDWLWRRDRVCRSAVASILLLKRINLVPS